jgi:hypothetical protein
MTADRPWWMNPTNRFANAIYPHFTESGKEKERKRKKVDPNARGATSPLGGVARPFEQPTKQRRK